MFIIFISDLLYETGASSEQIASNRSLAITDEFPDPTQWPKALVRLPPWLESSGRLSDAPA
jgi:hypothetical protein